MLGTRGPVPGVVVLTDAHFPGWSATVDGQPAPLHRANLNFRAVAVPAGEHTIEMRYAPAPLRRGWGLAALGLVVCVGAIVIERRPRTG